MKNVLFVSILILIGVHSITAQNWFEPDDHWVFRNYEWMSEGYSEAKITGDTMVNGILCKKMFFDSKNVTYQWGDSVNFMYNEIVYEKNDSVFYQNEWDEFELIYDFTMEVGDTLTIYGLAQGIDCGEPTYYILDSLSKMIMGLDTFKIQHINVEDTHWETYSEINVIETIGATSGNFFRHRDHACAFDVGVSVICSFTNEHNDYQFGEEDCFDLPVGVDPEILTDPILIYPNPADNIINIQAEHTPELIEFFNNQGQKVGVFYGTKIIDIGNFTQGVYMMKITRDLKHIVRKIMVH